ncbi:hypothetical protein JRI60_19315 [Archangium violaceum]|uniref:hypothetical protein n=1 Tax=Archangium violaceum TaxID=83451 RepID=UPI00194EB672|nr:hypothetical protein [Archangium violaceum]QRO01027.1 hypothetical protein JRI60_19315 [Archangium violaceum]
MSDKVTTQSKGSLSHSEKPSATYKQRKFHLAPPVQHKHPGDNDDSVEQSESILPQKDLKPSPQRTMVAQPSSPKQKKPDIRASAEAFDNVLLESAANLGQKLSRADLELAKEEILDKGQRQSGGSKGSRANKVPVSKEQIEHETSCYMALEAIMVDAYARKSKGGGSKAPSIFLPARRLNRNKRKVVYAVISIVGGLTVSAIVAAVTFGGAAVLIAGALAGPIISEILNWVRSRYYKKSYNKFMEQYQQGTFVGDKLSAVRKYIQGLQLTSITDSLADIINCKQKLKELQARAIHNCAAAEEVADKAVAIYYVWASKQEDLMKKLKGFGFFVDWCFDQLDAMQKDLTRAKVHQLYTFIQRQVRGAAHGKKCDVHFFGRGGSSFNGLCYQMQGDTPRKPGFKQWMTRGEFPKHRHDPVYRLFNDVYNVAVGNRIYHDHTADVDAFRALLEESQQQQSGENELRKADEPFFSLQSLFLMVDLSSALNDMMVAIKAPSALRNTQPSDPLAPSAQPAPIDPNGLKRILKKLDVMVEQDKKMTKAEKEKAWQELKELQKYCDRGEFKKLASVLGSTFALKLGTGALGAAVKQAKYEIKVWKGWDTQPGDAVNVPYLANMILKAGVQATGEMLNLYWDAKRLEEPIENTNEFEGLDGQLKRIDALRSVLKNGKVFDDFTSEFERFKKAYDEFKIAYARDEYNLKNRPDVLACGDAYQYARDLAILTVSWDKMMKLLRVVLELHQHALVTLSFTKEVDRAQLAVEQNIYDSLKRSHPEHAGCGGKVCYVLVAKGDAMKEMEESRFEIAQNRI